MSPQQIPAPTMPGQQGASQDVQGQQASQDASPQAPAAHPTPLALQSDTVTDGTEQVAEAPAPKEGSGLTEIEKEWVDKTRTVVDQTKGDPYAQSREISKIRAEYLRVRFDKHINVTEDQSK